ncbi:MAG: hypothetical protein ACTHOP_01870 [Mesorhizobium sp.]
MPRRVLFHIRAAAFSCLLAILMPASMAQAHRSAGNANDSGIAIPALTHGQMAVIADYRGEILDLAARQARTDETFRRLLTFGNIQYAYCLWGVVPGSLGDEASPFNECSHAYLSTVQALLIHMRGMNDSRSALGVDIEALISRIDADMVRNGASFVLCQFSSEDFNTASLIRPDWTAVPYHGPSAFSFAMLAAAMGGAGFAALRRKGTAPRHPAA